MTITDRIDQLADRLEAHKFITLHEVKSQPGLSEDAIDQLEREHGVKLSTPVRKLYTEANGFLLHWTMRPDLPGTVHAARRAGGEGYELSPKQANLEYPEAIIQFLPLEDVLGLDWSVQFFPDDQAAYDYRGERLDQVQLRAQLRPFDECGLFCAAAFADPSFERVVLITDSLANWNDSIAMSFTQYVDFVFASAGLLEARMDAFIRSGTVSTVDLEFRHDP